MTAYTVKHTKTGLLVIHDIDMRQRHAVLLVNSYPDRGEKKKPGPRDAMGVKSSEVVSACCAQLERGALTREEIGARPKRNRRKKGLQIIVWRSAAIRSTPFSHRASTQRRCSPPKP